MSLEESLPRSSGKQIPTKMMPFSESVSELFLNNQGLVRPVAKRLGYLAVNRGAYDYHDLISEGNFGLKYAAENYDASRGLAFSTYADSCIEGAMLNFLKRIKSKRDSKNVSLDEPRLGGDSTRIDSIATEATQPQYLNPLLKESVRKSLEMLPPLERAMITGTFYQNMSPDELSKYLGISRETVRRTVDVAKRRLKNILASSYANNQLK